MAWRSRRRWAHYSRNNSYSKSANAEYAESQGRYPRTRAARHLDVSAAAFAAGCSAAGYYSTEWHHVGKYATMVDYYDTNELRANPLFWQGCATAYKSKARKQQLIEKAQSCQEDANQPLSESATAESSPPTTCNALVPA